MKLHLFVPITKVDVEKREVWGRAVQEVPDKAKEIFDYETSAPLFRDWSAGFEKATDGKSLGNIRAMHGKVAAGKVTAIDFNDTDKAIDICAKVVDEAEWQKCLEGVYTGFSIGGSYEKTWKDGNLTRYTARPAEISIVDNPCVPTARFQMVKADGVVEEKEFKAPDPAAPETKKEEPAPVADATGEPAKAAPAEVKKSLYGVATLASLLSAAAGEARMAQWEADAEDDSSPVPSQLRAWLASGLQILNAMAAEESAELIAELANDASKAAPAGELAKVEKKEAAPDLAKLADDLAKLTTENEALKKRVDELEKMPEAPKGVQKVVTVAKEADSVLVKKEEVEDTTPLGLMKKAQSQPHVIKL